MLEQDKQTTMVRTITYTFYYYSRTSEPKKKSFKTDPIYNEMDLNQLILNTWFY